MSKWRPGSRDWAIRKCYLTLRINGPSTVECIKSTNRMEPSLVRQALRAMLKRGWVTRAGAEYRITDKGREEGRPEDLSEKWLDSEDREANARRPPRCYYVCRWCRRRLFARELGVRRRGWKPYQDLREAHAFLVGVSVALKVERSNLPPRETPN